MSTTIQVRVDKDLKDSADKLFKDLGTDTTTAIRIFLTQAVANNGFPFEIKRAENPIKPMSEEEIIDFLSQSRQEAREGKYTEAYEMVAELKAKYDL